MSSDLIEIDDREIEQLPPIRNDEIAEEVFAARQYAHRVERNVIYVESTLLVLFGMLILALALKPARHIYIKIDDLTHRAVPLQYEGLNHWTPDAAMARTYLEDWAGFRYRRMKADVLKTFPMNYLFIGKDKSYGEQIKNSDQRRNVVANVLAGIDPENDATVSAVIRTFGSKSVGSAVLVGGTADIFVRKVFQNNSQQRYETWVTAVTFYLNPEQVETQSSENPEYQRVNPMGLTIVDFVENRVNDQVVR